MNTLQLILIDPTVALCAAFRKYFGDLPNVKVKQGYFERLPEFDCMVSAANSFGLMDGGVDGAITRYFGSELMSNVQHYILSEYLGEQPVGSSFIIETGHAVHPYLAHTPTMRVPMDISHTDNVYLAMFAMLRAVYRHNKTADAPIRSVACPGLGTGAGHVPFGEAARQMALAYRNFLNPPEYLSWTIADSRQSEIRYGGDIGFHIPPAVE
jgi:O-acetyl-ADP-ribose deacetylase (regulator of RNase III)